MIVCPNCSHTNPEGATQCEACYTPLPQMMPCPNCGTSIQTDAVFCGQCGYNLQPVTVNLSEEIEMEETVVSPPPTPKSPVNLELEVTSPWEEELISVPQEEETAAFPKVIPETPPSVLVSSPEPLKVNPIPKGMTTQLQIQTAHLFHVQSEQQIELPSNLSVIHIGKPNEQIPPDVDVSGFPNSEIVSRIHADIRVEGDIYYLEDTGSSNGTYVNHTPLSKGNRHLLRPGDRISLGKGDLVTFIFQR